MTVEFERTLDSERAPWKLLFWLILGGLSFSVLDYLGNRSHWISSLSLRDVANVGREDSLHNFVSSAQELAVAGIACAFFTWIALDDGAALHERIGTALEDSVSFFPSYAWQVISVPIFAAAMLVSVHIVFRSRRASWTRTLFLVGIGCYILGVALDYLEGRDGAYDGFASAVGASISTVSHYSRVVEEFAEDVGASLFLVALLRHLLCTVGSFRFTVSGRRSEPDAEGRISAMSVQTETLQVTGIRCEKCVNRLGVVLKDHPGLEYANANLMGVVVLTYDDEQTTRDSLLTAMSLGGFRVLEGL